ncbi:MotA/TolQ/ExbB proton channel family protein [Thermogutta sp.]|uniref:MotA/TolQ/ExbB proton channel family protein n=1 Tax=Thermogutta sp. TaxID=1962930 RepID=UPI003C7AF7CE
MRTFRYILHRIASSPLVWGGALFALYLFSLKAADWPGAEFLRRYTTGHPIEYVETLLFFLGLSALASKGWRVAVEWSHLVKLQAGKSLRNTTPQELWQAIDADAGAAKESTFLRHIRAGVLYVQRRHSSRGLDEYLRELAQEEADNRRADYGFVRLVVWAIPILGFLGTVVGITLSLGNLSPQQLEETLPTVMGGLMVAFDTTALALALSMILMLVQYAVDRAEQKLVVTVSERVQDTLFPAFVGESEVDEDTQVRQTLRGVVQACEELVHVQIELWQRALKERDDAIKELWDRTSEALERAMTRALNAAAEQHAHRLQEIETAHLQQMAGWVKNILEPINVQMNSVGETLRRSAEVLAELENRLREDAVVWRNLGKGVGELAELQRLLDQNLSAVTSAKHFEEALATLAAAANLLSAHLHRLPADRGPRSEMHPSKAKAA